MSGVTRKRLDRVIMAVQDPANLNCNDDAGRSSLPDRVNVAGPGTAVDNVNSEARF
jgi:hypothetical protein